MGSVAIPESLHRICMKFFHGESIFNSKQQTLQNKKALCNLIVQKMTKEL